MSGHKNMLLCGMSTGLLKARWGVLRQMPADGQAEADWLIY